MKNKLLISIFLFLFMASSAYAIGSYYSTGMDLYCNTPLDSFDMGIYTNGAWTLPVANSKTGLGLGARADLTLSLPKAELSTSFMFGLAFDAMLGKNLMFTLILGPSIAVFSEHDDIFCVGAGADASVTVFVNSENTVGFVLGANGNFLSTILPEGREGFNFYGGGYFGLAMKFDGRHPYPPYPHYNVYIY